MIYSTQGFPVLHYLLGVYKYDLVTQLMEQFFHLNSYIFVNSFQRAFK